MMWTEGVSADTARLTIPLDTALTRLPPGASYTARSGRASVKATVRPSTDDHPAVLVIESGCDSLERLCWRYEAEVERLQAANAHLTQNAEAVAAEQHSNGVRMAIVQVMAGLALGIVITLITRKKLWQY